MNAETTPTRAQELWIYALNGLYNEPDLSPSERRRAERIVALKELTLTEKEDFAIVASYLLSENNRWRALQTIFRNFDRQREAGGQLDDWYFVAMAEFAEMQRLLQAEEFDTAIIRGCSFADHFLEDNVNWFRYTPIEFETDRDPNFAELINFVRKEGFIDRRDQKLLHFVREVRNHTAHHAWLKKDLEFEVLVLANRALLYEINRFIEEKASRDEVDIPEFEAEPELAEEYLRVVEEEFGWKYQEHRKYWVSR